MKPRHLEIADIGNSFELADGTKVRLSYDADGWFVSTAIMAFHFRSRSCPKWVWELNLYEIGEGVKQQGMPIGFGLTDLQDNSDLAPEAMDKEDPFVNWHWTHPCGEFDMGDRCLAWHIRVCRDCGMDRPLFPEMGVEEITP